VPRDFVERLSKDLQRGDSKQGGGSDEYELECQLLLADVLDDLNRDFEALRVLLKSYVNVRRGFGMNSLALELLDGVQRIHSKIESGESLASVTSIISKMQKIQESRNDMSTCQDLWFELVQLGAHYSKSARFGLADLCFESSDPLDTGEISWTTRKRLAEFRKELRLHHKRQEKRLECIWQLAMAFQQLLLLETDHDGVS